jgi:integrase
VLDAGRDPVTGRRKQRWESGFATRKVAEDRLADLLGEERRGELVVPSKTKLIDYVTTWVAGRDDLAPLSRRRYTNVVELYLRPHAIAAMPLASIKRGHVLAWERYLTTEKKLSKSTRGVCRAVLSGALASAVAGQLLHSNPAAGITRPKSVEERPRLVVPSREELRRFLDAVKGDRLEAMWRLLVVSGARRGEILGATWLSFSAAGRSLEITQQVAPLPGGPGITRLKSRRSYRTIALDQETVDLLEQHRERQLAERERAEDSYADHDLLFSSEIGAPLSPKAVSEAFHRHREAAGLPYYRLHDLRHACASHLLGSGRPLHAVAARLGNSPAIVLKTYAHLLKGDDEKAADVMANVLLG